jgi:hypothetical protein
MAWMKTKVAISPSLKPKDRIAISEAVIEYIKNRTLDGLDKNLEKFPNYTKNYAQFKGVSVSDVDLVFSGDMLSDLKLLSHKSGELTIGFEKGSKSNGKAEGNIKGTYGQPKPVQAPRDFLGISDVEVESLLDNLGTESESFSGLSDADIERRAREAAEEIFGDLQFE